MPLVPPYTRSQYVTESRMELIRAYGDHYDFPMHIPLEGVARSREEDPRQVQRAEPWQGLEDGPYEGNTVNAVEEGLGGDVNGHVAAGDKQYGSQ